MQTRVLDEIAYHLQPPGKARVKRRPGPRLQGYEDMVRLAAALERVKVERKVEIGEWLLTRLKKPSESPQSWWAVGRFGARVPFHGSAHNVVPPDIAHRWLEQPRDIEPLLTAGLAHFTPRPLQARRFHAAAACTRAILFRRN